MRTKEGNKANNVNESGIDTTILIEVKMRKQEERWKKEKREIAIVNHAYYSNTRE